MSPSVKNDGDVAVLYSFCSENYIADFMTNKSAMSLFNNENITLRAASCSCLILCFITLQTTRGVRKMKMNYPNVYSLRLLLWLVFPAVHQTAGRTLLYLLHLTNMISGRQADHQYRILSPIYDRHGIEMQTQTQVPGVDRNSGPADFLLTAALVPMPGWRAPAGVR